ncbi:MAG: hypothetical protein EPN84_08650 [Legionella sp.]|nr:MAG: hypothetical protein EPN84_08650 [Legionella sp.]
MDAKIDKSLLKGKNIEASSSSDGIVTVKTDAFIEAVYKVNPNQKVTFKKFTPFINGQPLDDTNSELISITQLPKPATPDLSGCSQHVIDFINKMRENDPRIEVRMASDTTKSSSNTSIPITNLERVISRSSRDVFFGEADQENPDSELRAPSPFD